jgi:hypothetical protein
MDINSLFLRYRRMKILLAKAFYSRSQSQTETTTKKLCEGDETAKQPLFSKSSSVSQDANITAAAAGEDSAVNILNEK